MKTIRLQSHPENRRDIFWDTDQWSKVMSEIPLDMEPTDPRLPQVATELDRRFVQIWDKQKHAEKVAIGLAQNIIDDFLSHAIPEQKVDQPCSASHLHWMCRQIIDCKDMSVTVRHRWLGFVQAGLTFGGFTDVQELRDSTRDKLQGA